MYFLLFNIFQIVFAWQSLCNAQYPGPKKKDKDCLSICHWNLNSISGLGYSKLLLLDIICLSETYLNSNTPLDDDNLEISG